MFLFPVRSGFPAKLAVVAVVLTGSWIVAVAAGAKRVVVQGRVVSEAGEPMRGWPVELIGTSRYVEIGKHTSGGDVASLARVSTDENGYFIIDLARERKFHFYFLRFADAATLDIIRYRVPEDEEITSNARRGRLSVIEKTIQLQPDWPEIERRIARAGGVDTSRGKVLRALGLPEKDVVNPETGEEEWWYFTKGILYTFRGAEPTGTRRFEPVKAPGAGDGHGSTGEAG